jgi:hypothetical protein
VPVLNKRYRRGTNVAIHVHRFSRPSSTLSREVERIRYATLPTLTNLDQAALLQIHELLVQNPEWQPDKRS